MEDNLLFPIGFNLKDLEAKWSNAEKEITKLIDRKTFKIKVSIDDTSIQKALDVLSRLEKMGGGLIKPSTTAAVVKATVNAEAKAKERLALSEEKVNTQRAKTLAVTQRMNTAMEKHNNHLLRQKGILNGMPQMLNSYISVLGAMRLTNNIRNVTAEFELQRVALAAIIQDKAKADELFGQIVELGIQSPFQIKELISYTKQLAAFRVESDKLFETTSRLADISAGLGVDMDRLILAYGQVRAASVLRGQELRQFTEAGIPLVDLLAKEFEKLNGVATTTGDVFEMISKRQVPFAMIKKIFEDMTNAGGVFYNMQKIQAETLKGVYSNLRDAYDKMFMQMGNANMGLLKGVGLGLRAMADNWEAIFDIMTKGAAVYGVYRLAILANNVVLGKENKAVLSNIMAKKLKNAEMLRQEGLYRKLEFSELRQIATARTQTKADFASAIASGALTKQKALRLVALRQIKGANAQYLVQLGLISRQELATAQSANILTISYRALTAGIRGVIAAMYASVKAMLTNPYTWAFALIGAAISLWAKHEQRMKKFREFTESMTTEMGVYYNELASTVEKSKDIINEGLSEKASNASVKEAINTLDQIISKNESLKPLIKERLKDVTDEVKKLQIMKQIYDDLVKSSKGEEGIRPKVLSDAFKDTGNLFNKDFFENMKKLEKQLSSTSTLFGKMAKDGVRGVTVLQDEFELAVKSFRSGGMSVEDFGQKLEDIRKNAMSKNSAAWNDITAKMELSRVSLKSVKKDFDEALKYIQANFREVNNQPISWPAPDKGLSEKNLKAFEVYATQAKEIIFRANQELALKSVLSNMWNTGFNLPTPDGTGGAKKSIGAFGKAVNKFITDNKFEKISIYDEKDDSKTEDVIYEDISEKLKEAIELQKRWTDQKTAGNKVNEKELEDINKKVIELQKLSDFIGMSDKDQGIKGKNLRAEALAREVDLIKEAYQQYEKLSERMDKDEAKGIITERFGGQTKLLKVAFTAEDFDKQMDNALGLFSTKEYGGKNSKEYWDAWDIQSDISLGDFNTKVKNELDLLGKEISQTQKANNFYEKLLGITSDAQLSKSIALEVTGFEVGDIRSKLRDQIIKAVDGKIDIPMGKIDVSKLRMDLLGADISKKQMELIDKYIEAYVDANETSVEKLFSSLDKYQSYENKKTEILRKAQELRDIAIETGQLNQLAAISTMTDKQLAELEYENFKTTDMYLDLFGNLDNISTDALYAMRDKVIEISKTIGSSLSPTNAKEILSKIDDLTKQIIERNPFKEWAKSKRDIEALKSTISYLEGSGLGAGFILNPLKADLANLEGDAKKAEEKMVEEMKTLQTAAAGVVSGVSDIFEEFGVGADSIAGQSLSIMKEIGNGVMSVLSITSKAAANAIGSVEKASVILTIISLALKVGLMVYNMLSKENRLKKEIETLTLSLDHLKETYDSLSGTGDAQQLKRLKEEIAIRQNLINTTLADIRSKKHSVRAVDKYNEYIGQTNMMLKYQSELFKVINSDMNNIAKGAKSRVGSLKEQNALLAELIKKERARGGKMEIEKIMDMQKQVAENEINIAYAFLDSLNEATGDIFTTLTDSVADALYSAWQAGEDGAKAYRDTVHDVMKDVIRDLWKVNILPKLMEPVMSKIYTALGLDENGKVRSGATPDFKIDAREAAVLSQAIAKTEKEVISSWEGIADLLDMFSGDKSGDLTGLTKAVGSMSEETALTLSGYFNSLLYYSVAQYNIQAKIYEELQRKGYNDNPERMGSLLELESIQSAALENLKSIANNTGRSADGISSLVDLLTKASLPGGKKINVSIS